MYYSFPLEERRIPGRRDACTDVSVHRDGERRDALLQMLVPRRSWMFRFSGAGYNFPFIISVSWCMCTISSAQIRAARRDVTPDKRLSNYCKSERERKRGSEREVSLAFSLFLSIPLCTGCCTSCVDQRCRARTSSRDLLAFLKRISLFVLKQKFHQFAVLLFLHVLSWDHFFFSGFSCGEF